MGAEGVRGLRGLLLAGTIYLCAVAVAHFLGYKAPGLYIYYDVPSTVYQDRVIGTLCAAMAVLMLGLYRTASVYPQVVRSVPLAGAVLLAGFGLNTLYSPEITRSAAYWAQILGLAVYVGSLVIAVRRAGREPDPSAGAGDRRRPDGIMKTGGSQPALVVWEILLLVSSVPVFRSIWYALDQWDWASAAAGQILLAVAGLAVAAYALKRIHS